MALWCRGRDSNPHSLAATAPSTLRVYQFRHLGRILAPTRMTLPATCNYHYSQVQVQMSRGKFKRDCAFSFGLHRLQYRNGTLLYLGFRLIHWCALPTNTWRARGAPDSRLRGKDVGGCGNDERGVGTARVRAGMTGVGGVRSTLSPSSPRRRGRAGGVAMKDSLCVVIPA